MTLTCYRCKAWPCSCPDGITLIHGDCREVLPLLEAGSVGLVVTDPPAGISFMGKAWDSDKGGRDVWIEWLECCLRACWRVAKPGAGLLCWAIPRTSGWTQRALEDAEWQPYDVITHLFGSGFPKSLDVSKAIDKAAGAERVVVGKHPAPCANVDATPAHGGAYRESPDITAPATPEAKTWQGYGTALKPAVEFWWLCRKPLDDTFAHNALEHGVAGINVDGARIGTEDTLSGSGTPPLQYGGENSRPFHENAEPRGCNQHLAGRWPANLILSHHPECQSSIEGTEAESKYDCHPDCPVGILDEQSGERPGFSGGGTKGAGFRSQYVGGDRPESNLAPSYFGDTGTASRFFYCAKASSRDRGNLPAEELPLFNEGVPEFRNQHPTVKPLELMRYLLTLLYPPSLGAVCLDPFAGSGTTGVAAKQMGRKCILIEMDKEFCSITAERLTQTKEGSCVS